MQTNGLVVARYSYEPFGRLLTMSGALAEANTYRFSSKEWQERSGLYYYGFRFYEPALQRWVNRDPVQEIGGLNLFGFVLNDPLRLFEPFGLSPLFNDPQNGGSEDPLGDFGKQCGKGLWDEYGDDFMDWVADDFLGGKVGLCYDNLGDCVKDTIGLDLPGLGGDKKEDLGLGWPRKKKEKKGVKLCIGLKKIGLEYNSGPWEIGARCKFGKDDDKKFEITIKVNI